MLTLLLLLSCLFSADQYTVTNIQANGYYVAENASPYDLYFQEEDIIGGTVHIGDNVIGLFAKDDEDTFLGVISEK